VFGLIAVALATTGSFIYLAAASSIARLLVYVLSIASIPIIRRKADPEMQEQAFRLPGGLTIPILAIALCAWVASKASAQAWILLAGLLAAGLVLMTLEQLRVRRSRTP